MNPKRRIGVLIAKPGFDGHDRGARIIIRVLRYTGHETLYTGLHQTTEQIVAPGIQEGVDLIGLCILSGLHDYLLSGVVEFLKEEVGDDITTIGSRIISEEDITKPC